MVDEKQKKTDFKSEEQSGIPEKQTKCAPKASSDNCFRPENEDDDGYDPYSDYRAKQSFFEPDPWN